MRGYHPPTYPLLEARFRRSENDTTRWLYGWNGAVTEAARDVTLAASAPAGRALVTSGLWADEPSAQLSALLAANALERSRLFPGADIETALKDMSWSPAPLTINGESAQIMIGRIGDSTAAYAIDVPAQIAAAWVEGSELESLSAIDATEYLINPLELHSYASLNEQASRVRSVLDYP